MGGLIRPARYIGAAGLLVVVVCHAASYLPFDTQLYRPLLFGSFPIILVLALVVVLAQNERHTRIDDLIRHLRPLERWLLGLALAYLVVDFALMMAALPGQPEARGDHYFMNVHGALNVLSREDYDAALRHVVRLYSGHEVAFYLLVVTMLTLVLRWDSARSADA